MGRACVVCTRAAAARAHARGAAARPERGRNGAQARSAARRGPPGSPWPPRHAAWRPASRGVGGHRLLLLSPPRLWSAFLSRQDTKSHLAKKAREKQEKAADQILIRTKFRVAGSGFHLRLGTARWLQGQRTDPAAARPSRVRACCGVPAFGRHAGGILRRPCRVPLHARGVGRPGSTPGCHPCAPPSESPASSAPSRALHIPPPPSSSLTSLGPGCKWLRSPRPTSRSACCVRRCAARPRRSPPTRRRRRRPRRRPRRPGAAAAAPWRRRAAYTSFRVCTLSAARASRRTGAAAPGDALKLRCPVCDQKVVLAEAAGMDALPSSAFLLSNLLDAVVATAEEPPSKNGRPGAAGAGGHSNHRHHAHPAHPRAAASAPPLPPAPPPSAPSAPSRSAPGGGPAASSSALLLRRPHGCSSCDEGNAASSRCLDCQEHLCDNCVRAQQRVRLTKDHYIERGPPAPAAASPAQQLGLGPPFPGAPFSILSIFPERLGFCQHHDDEVSECARACPGRGPLVSQARSSGLGRFGGPRTACGPGKRGSGVTCMCVARRDPAVAKRGVPFCGCHVFVLVYFGGEA